MITKNANIWIIKIKIHWENNKRQEKSEKQKAIESFAFESFDSKAGLKVQIKDLK